MENDKGGMLGAKGALLNMTADQSLIVQGEGVT